jgi:hypothetical protein
MYLPDEQRYGKMTHRRCGASGLWLLAISLGLWHNFGGADALENAKTTGLYDRRNDDVAWTKWRESGFK